MIDRRTGVIINIASISTSIWTTAHAAYSSSKAAVVTMTRDIAAEVAEFGVRVNAVAPGPIDSKHEWTAPRAGVLMPFVGIPRDIAAAVAFIDSDEARFITGETITVAGASNLKAARP
jgi:NAD(P)-dependent dehydrogenase (short-subunit alcohol dehydrogenase family)